MSALAEYILHSDPRWKLSLYWMSDAVSASIKCKKEWPQTQQRLLEEGLIQQFSSISCILLLYRFQSYGKVGKEKGNEKRQSCTAVLSKEAQKCANSQQQPHLCSQFSDAKGVHGCVICSTGHTEAPNYQSHVHSQELFDWHYFFPAGDVLWRHWGCLALFCPAL